MSKSRGCLLDIAYLVYFVLGGWIVQLIRINQHRKEQDAR